MERYVCIHGHFYQPPRENAWLETIEMQDSAYPYHDWNERVTAECYAPNTASRILDNEGFITLIVNNYEKISFNFGPTLLAWMEANNPDTYKAILEADRRSLNTYSGHGSAIAQSYGHIIMPLATKRDKYTQVLWGLRDFEHRFNRTPEGMWLPETAVDIETLEIMAGMGIRFTILAPHQASRVRKKGSNDWNDVINGSIDPSQAYEIILPSGNRLYLFFYNGPISRNIAFENVLRSGDNLSQLLIESFSEEAERPQIIHVATDGETYGHHHRFGDMALAYALHDIETDNRAQITNYGEFLEKHPPDYEVEILENTSWSCPHGIERWRNNCGCNAGRNPAWNQAWRAPLREALDWLRDTLAPSYEEKARQFLNDPWLARDEYINIILNKSSQNTSEFFQKHRSHELDKEETVIALKLLELQRHAMLMYTSCGWFFDELSGIETVQVIQYAGRAMQLADELLGNGIEEDFLGRLEKARSNIPEHSDGRKIYEKFVKPSMVDLTKVGAHFAVSSLFEEYDKNAEIYCYKISIDDYQTLTSGKLKLALGRAGITSEITGESDNLSFGVLHFGDHNVNAGVRTYRDEPSYQEMCGELGQTFSAADFPEVIRLLDKHFGVSTYSIKDLFRDEQRKVLDNILEAAFSDIEAAYHQVYEHHYPPMRFLSELGNPIPKSFHQAAEFILNNEIRKVVDSDSLDLERLNTLLDEIRIWKVDIDAESLSYLLQNTMERMMSRILANPSDMDTLKNMLNASEMLPKLPFSIDLWRVQNFYHNLLHSKYLELKAAAEQGDRAGHDWVEIFKSLGQKLSIRTG